VTQTWIKQNPIKAWQRLHHDVPECDHDLFKQYGPRYLKPAFMRDVLDEVYRQGLAGPERAEALLAEPWGFDLSAIQARTFIWQGLLDAATPPAMGHYWAQTIAGSQLHELPQAGHWFFLRDWQKVLAEVVGK
jgi:pimeloyl-ACP methyl ester carboxylesterase